MKKIDSLVFLAALLLFGFVGFYPGSRALAQMVNWCPGGSALLCGTTTERTCLSVDPRTAQCSAWREQTLYYYYPPNGSGGSGGGSDPGDGGCGGGGPACFE